MKLIFSNRICGRTFILLDYDIEIRDFYWKIIGKNV